jgi:signal transduction histidine kinase
VTVVAVGPNHGLILGCLAAILGGALIGIARRQAVERTELAARTEVAAARVEVERDRATLLSERNHLAREIHDVLAHTLAALSVQLEAFGRSSRPNRTPAARSVTSSTGPASSSTRVSRRPAAPCRRFGTTRFRWTTS